MNVSKLLKNTVLAAVIPIFLAVATPAEATYMEQIVERSDLQDKIKGVQSSRQQFQELQLKYLSQGKLESAKAMEKVLKEHDKSISQLQSKLAGVERKIAKSEKLIGERARDLVRDGMRDNSRTAARSGIGDTVRSGVRTTSQGASRTSSAPASPMPYGSPAPGH